MASAVYMMCTIMSIACGVLLFRGFSSSGNRLLFWSAWGFAGLGLNSVLLFLDLVLLPGANLSVLRALVAVVSVLVLLFGLVWESK